MPRRTRAAAPSARPSAGNTVKGRSPRRIHSDGGSLAGGTGRPLLSGWPKASVRVANHIGPLGELEDEAAIVDGVIHLHVAELDGGALAGAVGHLQRGQCPAAERSEEHTSELQSRPQ